MVDVDARLAEIAERAERAMPGPWCYMATGDKDNSWSLGTAVWPDDTPVRGFVNYQEQERFNEETMEGEQVTPVDLIAEHYGTANMFAEAGFIAHAREDVPWLLAVLKEQAGQIERLQAVVREHWSPSQAEAILEATADAVARSGGES